MIFKELIGIYNKIQDTNKIWKFNPQKIVLKPQWMIYYAILIKIIALMGTITTVLFNHLILLILSWIVTPNNYNSIKIPMPEAVVYLRD